MKHETDVKLHAFSGWIDPPTDLQPAVSGEITCDTAVIGGGVGGMGTTMRLAERGQDVALIEAEFLGYGSSSRNGGHISGAPGGDLRMLKLFYPKQMKGMVILADHAAEYLQGKIHDLDIECDYVPNGLAMVAVRTGGRSLVVAWNPNNGTVAALTHLNADAQISIADLIKHCAYCRSWMEPEPVQTKAETPVNASPTTS